MYMYRLLSRQMAMAIMMFCNAMLVVIFHIKLFALRFLTVGESVYSNKSSDIQSIIWDGTFKGKALDPGVYAWFFEYEYIRNGTVNHKTISGEVHIFR